VNMDFNEVEKKVAAYKGNKVAIIVTGGGQGIAQLSTIPGVSKVLHSIIIPYSYEESERLIDDELGKGTGKSYTEKAVSESSAELLCLSGLYRWANCKVIACTAATTTNRWRRGVNQAFIATGRNLGGEKPIDHHHLKFSKLLEEDHKTPGGYASWKRRDEDRQITEYILKLIFGEGR